MDIRHVGDHECISCGKCISACPTKAIELRAGKLILAPDEKKTAPRFLHVAGWILAIALLAGVFFYVNRTDPADDPTPTPPVEDVTQEQTSTDQGAEDNSTEPAPEIGNAIGMTAPDFTVPLYNGNEFSLSEQRGKVVVVNFWATWCTPCCAELPFFNAVYEEFSENVAVVAIHSELVTDDVVAYLSGYSYTLPFGLDETGSAAKLLGVSTMLPHTIIIDGNGVVTYNAAGSLNYDELLVLIAQAQGQ